MLLPPIKSVSSGYMKESNLSQPLPSVSMSLLDLKTEHLESCIYRNAVNYTAQASMTVDGLKSQLSCKKEEKL